MSKHLKRIASPKKWPIAKKTHIWVTKPNPGPHSLKQAIPLIILLRDVLKLADNMRETKRILNEGNVLVDGTVRKDHKFPVGLFDVIQIPKLKTSYRILLDPNSRLMVNELDTQDPMKPVQILDKTIIRGGKVQLNLHDGTNILGSNEYKTKDTIILSIPDKGIHKHIKYEQGNLALVIGGTHSGELARINEIKKVRSGRHNMVLLEKKDGTSFETIEDYVFVVGIDEPEFNLGGAVRE
ncbi:MAG: 30S ribosomal protein S4e [Methanosarcinales archaeon]|nr:30S ribosomal protein S4e [Methanosarcinales archaeon]